MTLGPGLAVEKLIPLESYRVRTVQLNKLVLYEIWYTALSRVSIAEVSGISVL